MVQVKIEITSEMQTQELIKTYLAGADHPYIDGKVKESLGIACTLRILGLLGDTAGHHLDHF